MNPWGMLPGEPYAYLATRRRKWWQFWKRKRWLEWETRYYQPEHINCRCVIKDGLE